MAQFWDTIKHQFLEAPSMTEETPRTEPVIGDIDSAAPPADPLPTDPDLIFKAIQQIMGDMPFAICWLQDQTTTHTAIHEVPASLLPYMALLIQQRALS